MRSMILAIGIVLGLLVTSPALAAGESVYIEVVNHSSKEVTIQVSINAFPDLTLLRKRKLKAGAKTVYTNAQTRHEETGETVSFLGWTLKYDNGCNALIQSAGSQCQGKAGTCDKALLEKIAPCAYRWTIRD